MSDDDLIRRGDALALFDAPFLSGVEDMIRNLPAVTPARSPGVTAGAVGEPVAWRIDNLILGDVEFTGDAQDAAFADAYNTYKPAARRVTPLYATPPSPLDDPKVRKLVEAAKEVGRISDRDHVAWRALSAALRDMAGA